MHSRKGRASDTVVDCWNSALQQKQNAHEPSWSPAAFKHFLGLRLSRNSSVIRPAAVPGLTCYISPDLDGNIEASWSTRV